MFVVGGFSDLAHAYVADHACDHYQMEQHNKTDSEPCHSEQSQNKDENQEQGSCNDCCCVHSQTITTFNAPLKTPMNVNVPFILVSSDNHNSFKHSALRRPPRF